MIEACCCLLVYHCWPLRLCICWFHPLAHQRHHNEIVCNPALLLFFAFVLAWQLMHVHSGLDQICHKDGWRVFTQTCWRLGRRITVFLLCSWPVANDYSSKSSPHDKLCFAFVEFFHFAMSLQSACELSQCVWLWTGLIFPSRNGRLEAKAASQLRSRYWIAAVEPAGGNLAFIVDCLWAESIERKSSVKSSWSLWLDTRSQNTWSLWRWSWNLARFSQEMKHSLGKDFEGGKN